MQKVWRKMVEAVLHKRDGGRRQGLSRRDRGKETETVLMPRHPGFITEALDMVPVLMIHLTSEAGSPLCLGK